MMTITVNFDLTLLFLVAANVLALLVRVMILKHRARVAERNTARISAAIREYFSNCSVQVGVDNISRVGGTRFIAVIDSEPLKRFRYSHIVEINLRTHVMNTCGLDLERVYWRFPIQEKQAGEQAGEQAAPAQAMEKPAAELDEYRHEGLERLKEHPGYDIAESSWEQFSNAAEQIPEVKH